METSLPIEIIEIILSCENLSISDVVNFSLTNSYYMNAIRNLRNAMWKKKFFQTWPEYSEFFEKECCEICWYDEIRYVYDLKRRSREMLLKLYRHVGGVAGQLLGSNYKQWTDFCNENPRTHNYLVQDLAKIVCTAINNIRKSTVVQIYKLKYGEEDVPELMSSIESDPFSARVPELSATAVERLNNDYRFGEGKSMVPFLLVPSLADVNDLAEMIEADVKVEIDSNSRMFDRK